MFAFGSPLSMRQCCFRQSIYARLPYNRQFSQDAEARNVDCNQIISSEVPYSPHLGPYFPPQLIIVPQEGTDSPIQAGDADQDLDFDQFDLVRVQVAAKYLTSDRVPDGCSSVGCDGEHLTAWMFAMFRQKHD
jgi:hypothetical protein